MNWVRRVAEDGRCAEYDSLGAWEAESGAAADSLVIETPLPHSLSLPESFWKRAAARLVPGGLLRIQAALPADLPPPAPGAAPSGRLQAFAQALESFGLAFVSSQPEHLQEYEFLDRHLGQAAAWLGCERTEACRFVRLTFCQPAPPAAPRLKLGLITQDLYYSFVYESPALEALFKIRKMEYRPFCEPEYYQPLYDFQPDVLLVFRPDYLLPKTLARFRCPVIGYASEPLPRLRGGEVLASDYNRQSYELLKKVRGCCDRLYHYDPDCIEFLRAEGFPVAGLFPPCVSTDVYRPDPFPERRWDAVFLAKSTPHRERYLASLHLVCHFFHGAHGLEGAREVLPFLHRAHIGLNIHRDETPNLEPRIPILMASGLFVLTEELSPNPWFEAGRHYAVFHSEPELGERIRHYLRHADERAQIAAAARAWVETHASSVLVLRRLVGEVLGRERA